MSSQASLELLGGSAEVCILLTFRWPHCRALSQDKGLLETFTCAYNTWDVQKLNAKSNLQEHTVQRGKVDERRDRGGENRDSEQSRNRVIVFTVHQRMKGIKKKPGAERFR